MDPKLGNEPVNFPGRYPVHIRLHHHPQKGFLAAFAGFEETREVVFPGAFAWNLEIDFTHPGFPPPGPVAVAVTGPLPAHLTQTGTDLRGDLSLHQLPGNQFHRLPEEIGMLIHQRFRDNLGRG